MYKRILVPVDGSEGASRALDEASRLAQIVGAEVQAVFVLEHPPQLVDAADGFVEDTRSNDKSSQAATAVLDEARERLAKLGVQSSLRAVDSYGDSLASVLMRVIDEFRADLVVMYSHGRSGLWRLLAGSVAESLLRETSVPLLLLRNGEQGASETL